MELLPLVCLCLLSCSGDAVRVVVEEGSDAVLPCLISTEEDITRTAFDWMKDGWSVFLYDAGNHYNNGLPGQDEQFKGRVLFFQDQLQNGNASIKIRRTKMTDSGTYSCVFPRHQRQTFIIELVVDLVLKDRTGENIPGAAPEPVIKLFAVTKDGVLLQCEAHGDPLPTVEWKDGDNNTLPAEEPQISERGGRYYITVKTTVTKTDNYSCVATQEKFSHQVASVTYVRLTGAAPEPVPPPESGSNTGWIVAGVFITLFVVAVVLYFKKSNNQCCAEGSRRNTTNGPTDTELTSTMIR